MARLCGGRLMWATCARDAARVFLAFLTIWLAAATPSMAQERPPDPVNVQVQQTGPNEVTVTFEPGVGGGPQSGFFIFVTPDGIGSAAAGSPFVFSSLPEGDHTINVYATGVAPDFPDSNIISVDVTILPAATLTFNTIPTQAFGAALDLGPYISTTNASGVTFASDTPSVCDVSGQALVQITVGECRITASATADSGYFPPTPVQQTFMIGPDVPGAPSDVTAVAGNGQATVSFTPSSFDGGATIDLYEVSSLPATGVATGAGSPITLTGLTNGISYSFSVRAHNSVGYGAAASSASSVTPMAGQTITFNNPGPQNFGATSTLTASADSGLTVVFSSTTTGVCTITQGGDLTTVTAGSCSINADQAGDAGFSPAATQTQTFDINAVVPGAPTIGTATAGDTYATVSFSPPVFTGGASITGYTVTSSPDGLSVSGAGSPLTIPGLTNGVAYSFTVTATNVAGPGAASAASSPVTPKASQLITFNPPNAQNFGTTPTLTATSDSGLTPTFTSSTAAVCTITGGGDLTFAMAGDCTIDADQAGNGSYLPAATVSRTFAVNAVVPGAPVIGSVEFGDAQATVYFSPPSSSGGATIIDYTVTASPGGATATGNGSPITVMGLSNGVTYTFTVTARTSAGTGAASSASSGGQPLGAQTILFTATAQQQVGVAASLSATASSGMTVSFSSLTPSICTITSGGALTLIAPGLCTIRASQGGGSGYAAAIPVDQSFNVIAATPTAVIPTLTEWAMMLLAGLLALAGAVVVSRRRSGAGSPGAA